MNRKHIECFAPITIELSLLKTIVDRKRKREREREERGGKDWDVRTIDSTVEHQQKLRFKSFYEEASERTTIRRLENDCERIICY